MSKEKKRKEKHRSQLQEAFGLMLKREANMLDPTSCCKKIGGQRGREAKD
jgi:hypothetical protein